MEGSNWDNTRVVCFILDFSKVFWDFINAQVFWPCCHFLVKFFSNLPLPFVLISSFCFLPWFYRTAMKHNISINDTCTIRKSYKKKLQYWWNNCIRNSNLHLTSCRISLLISADFPLPFSFQSELPEGRNIAFYSPIMIKYSYLIVLSSSALPNLLFSENFKFSNRPSQSSSFELLLNLLVRNIEPFYNGNVVCKTLSIYYIRLNHPNVSVLNQLTLVLNQLWHLNLRRKQNICNSLYSFLCICLYTVMCKTRNSNNQKRKNVTDSFLYCNVHPHLRT